jgi:hypothetical protein
MKKKLESVIIIPSGIASDAAIQQSSPKLAFINEMLAKFGSPAQAVRR